MPREGVGERGRGEERWGRGGEVGAIKNKRTATMGGMWGEDGGHRRQRTRGVSETLRGSVRVRVHVHVCVSESPSLSLSTRIRIRGFVGTLRVCLLSGLLEEIGKGRRERERREGEGHPQPGPWLAQLHRSVWEGAGGSCRSRVSPVQVGGRNGGKGRHRWGDRER